MQKTDVFHGSQVADTAYFLKVLLSENHLKGFWTRQVGSSEMQANLSEQLSEAC